MKLHETITHTYKKVIRLLGIQVFTDDGWTDINSVNITEPNEVIKIISQNGKQLLCSPKHILIDNENIEILAKDCIGKTIRTENGTDKIIEIKKIDKKICLYDLSLSQESSHLYYTNGFLSHNCIICDEFAFLQRNIADKLFTSMYPTISSSKNGKFIIVSTPNGTDNLYYDIWQQANAKDQSKNLDGWKPFEMYWWQVPGHDEEWKKKQIAAIGERRFAQEFNNEFLTSDGTAKLIPGEIIDKFKLQIDVFKKDGFLPKKQRIVSQDEKELFEFDMWHEFEPQKTYAASMDISEGVGQDASVLYIWDITDLENIKMCAKFSDNRISLVQFAYVARKMLALYNDPPLAGERNGVSAGTMDSLRITYGYDNIVRENKKNEAGIYSHVTVKERACQWAKTMITTRGINFTIYDKELVDEMGIFCRKDTKGKHLIYEALPGPNSHDDHMMSFIWLTYILNPDIIDKYFVVCQTFADDFGNIYPKILQPLNAYTSESWRKIKDDPLYKDFLEFKEESKKHCKILQDAERKENENDMFKFSGIRNHDDYFGDDDGASWDQDPRTNGNWQQFDQAKWMREQEILKRRISTIPAYFI